MKAAEAAPDVPDVPAMTLEELHKAVQRRLWLSHPYGYRPLEDRLHNVKAGVASGPALMADLTVLLDAPDDVLRRMTFHGATDARCISPHMERVLQDHAAADARRALQAVSRPRMTAAELVQQFAARGVTITAGLDGNLHVSPANLLTAADREVLTACKPGILAALATPAAVI